MDNKTVQKTVKTNNIDEKNKLEEQIEKLTKEKDGYKDSYLRALADYHNLEKRMQEDSLAARQAAQAQLILRLLPFLDDLQKAEVFVKDQGLKLVKDNFAKALKDFGLEEMEVAGREFDPQYSEAVDIIEGEKENIIIEVLRKGYMFGGKILRVAQVKVSKKKL